MSIMDERIVTEDSDADVAMTPEERAARAQLWASERDAGMTYREIGDKYGVSHERVRQVLKNAGIPPVPRNWVAHHRRAELAGEVTTWLKANGPTPVDVVHKEFHLSSQRLTDLVTDYGVPKEYIMSGTNKSATSIAFEDVAAAVGAAWKRVLEDEPDLQGLSVGVYDRNRVEGDPSPALITSRWGWRTVCAAAGVPTGGAGRPQYTPKWSDAELIGWVGKYAAAMMADGERVTFDGYDKWRHEQAGAPSGAALRTRLRRSGYDSWAAMVAAGTKQ
jgi:Sigma-70, region 4